MQGQEKSNEELEKYNLLAAGTTCKGGVAVKSLVRVNPGPNPSSYLGQRWNIYLPHVDTQTNSPHSEKVQLERFNDIVSMYQSRPILIGKSRWKNSSPQHFRILFIWHWSYYW